jgi:hypothetical protein
VPGSGRKALGADFFVMLGPCSKADNVDPWLAEHREQGDIGWPTSRYA